MSSDWLHCSTRHVTRCFFVTMDEKTLRRQSTDRRTFTSLPNRSIRTQKGNLRSGKSLQGGHQVDVTGAADAVLSRRQDCDSCTKTTAETTDIHLAVCTELTRSPDLFPAVVERNIPPWAFVGLRPLGPSQG